MTLTSTNDSVSIFKDGKLKPGIYRIQNVVGQTYVDVPEHTNELCCRPATLLEGRGLWEILPFGPGYTIRGLGQGKPGQFCTMLVGLGNRSVVSVATFPVTWRMETVHDKRYRGCEYVRFFWGTTNMTWDLDCGSDEDRTPVHIMDNDNREPCRIWKLIPVQSDFEPQSTAGSGSLPPYDGNQHCTCSHQSTETSEDGFGTTVVEVTTTTNTITTRKKYRVEGGCELPAASS